MDVHFKVSTLIKTKNSKETQELVLESLALQLIAYNQVNLESALVLRENISIWIPWTHVETSRKVTPVWELLDIF